MSMEGEVLAAAVSHDDKMCRRCFLLFQQATDLILATHEAEQAMVASCLTDIEQALDLLLGLIKPRSKAHNTLVQEINSALRSTMLDRRPYAGLKAAIRKLDQMCEQINSEPRLESLVAECQRTIIKPASYERFDDHPVKLTVCPVESQSKAEVKKYSIFSCESSRDDKNLTVNIKNLYETASFNKICNSNSERNIKVPNSEMSEIDKRIKELEEEKCRAEEEKFVAQLPSTYSMFSKKKSLKIEGKSLEMNSTIETAINQMSVNVTQEIKVDKTEDGSFNENAKSDISVTKGSRNPDLKAIVYKVSNRMLDLDKFERRKSRNCTKENKDDGKPIFKGQGKTVNLDQELERASVKVDQTQANTVNFNKRRLTPTLVNMERNKARAEKISKTPDITKKAAPTPLLKLDLPRPN